MTTDVILHRPHAAPELRYNGSQLDVHALRHFLQGVHHKIATAEKIASATGQNFNVFNILGVETYEVSTHSAFLCELLDPRGSHGQGALFLNLFLARFSDTAPKSEAFMRHIREFHTGSATSKAEDYIGRVGPDYTEGGRIDIVITDAQNKRIFIENKINAKDQTNQLFRYHRHDPQAALFYLTLNGDAPCAGSLGTGKQFYVHLISYKEDILQWLLQCRKEAVCLPGVRETLTHYIQVVRQLTNQTESQSMKDEIKRMFVENPEYAAAVGVCFQALAEIISEAGKNFLSAIGKRFADAIKPIPISRDASIEISFAEDGDGFYVTYQLKQGKNNISGSALGQNYATLLKAIDPKFISNARQIGWHNPVGFSRGVRVAGLDKTLLIKFYTRDKELEDFAQRIVSREKEIRDALEKAIFSQ